MRGARIAIVMAVLLTAAGAAAQVIREVDLGGGLSVREERTMTLCWGRVPPCAVWEPVGFSFGGIDLLRAATAFGRVPESGRIVASIFGLPSGARLPWSWVGAYGLLYSDDRGASWSAGHWDWPASVRVFSFEPTGTRGVAAGDNGYVWTTEDGGTSWRDRGSSSGVRYVDAARVGRTIVVVDDEGTAFRSRDLGFSRDTLAEGVSAPVRIDGGQIVVVTSSGETRVDEDGDVHRP